MKYFCQHQILEKSHSDYSWPHFEKQDGRHRHVADFKGAYISLIIGPKGMACEANL